MINEQNPCKNEIITHTHIHTADAHSRGLQSTALTKKKHERKIKQIQRDHGTTSTFWRRNTQDDGIGQGCIQRGTGIEMNL